MNDKLIDIKVPGYFGLWSEHKSEYYFGTKYRLMYNNRLGCKMFRLVITDDFSQIYETFKDIKNCLIDNNILEKEIKNDT